MREGSYTTADGQTVSFTDGDTFRDVADLWAIIKGEYEGTPSATSEALKEMLGNLQAGKPLSGLEWSLLRRFQVKYADKLDAFRASPDNETEGFVPVPSVGSGRITEALATLPPSLRARIKENYSTESTTTKDRHTTTPHLLDGVLHDIAHAFRHADRLNDSDVRGDKGSLDFNVEHVLNHLESARDHASRLGQHLEQHPSNPKAFSVERTMLHKLREAEVERPALPDPINPSHRPTICVDFDGVIHAGPHGMPGIVEGTIMKGAAQGIKALNQRYRVVVLTARQDFGAVRDWLKKNKVSDYIDDVTNIKPQALAYIDDRAVHFDNNWPDMVKAVDPGIAVKQAPVAIHESTSLIPPNLRWSDPHDEALVLDSPTPVHECCTCSMFNVDERKCSGYGNIPYIDPDQVCDEWYGDPNWRAQVVRKRYLESLGVVDPVLLSYLPMAQGKSAA